MKRYEQCAIRLEYRGKDPPTKEHVDALVEGLLESGVEACWHSAVDYVGRPLFPSEIFPNCHPRANFESFRYLIERLHEIGRPVLSWYPLNMCRSLTEVHPDWQMKFMECEGIKPNPEDAINYCCFNSPYGELLPKFAVEIVQDVGFDGIWFDGSTFSHHGTWTMFQPGCVCDFCRDKFKRDAGFDLPSKVDYEDHTFRMWVNWRYDILMNVWKRIVEAVKAVKPEAVVCFNNYRRRSSGSFGSWTTAIPLRRLGLDAIMSSELNGFPHQADIQMKINMAYDCRRGVESWWPLCDYWKVWVPDVEPLTAVQAVLGCITAGGVLAAGTGVEVKDLAYVLKRMQDAAAPRMPYLGGEPVRYAAILASQQTMDFWGKSDPLKVWDEIHGANEILRHAHLLSFIIFDDYLVEEDLRKFPVVIIGDAACLSTESANALRRYVEGRGVLFACAHAGELDELGYPHKQPVLDHLLGITSREPTTGMKTMQFKDKELISVCGRFMTFKDVPLNVDATEDSDISATMLMGVGPPEDNLISWKNVGKGLWLRQVGDGHVIYTPSNLFGDYLKFPTPSLMRLIQTLLFRLAPPPITIEGPMSLTVNAQVKEEGKWAVHIHNCPGTIYSYPNPPYSNYIHTPGEVIPARNVVIKANKLRINKAKSGVTGRIFKVENNKVLVPEIELQDIILIEVD